MEILDIKLANSFKLVDFYVLALTIEVASGTYIRSIAEELGRRMNLPATLANLRRTRIGKFKIEDSSKV